jgi:Fe-S cluster assembly protein SufD
MVVDGQIVFLEVDDALARRGLRVGSPAEAPSLGDVMTEATDLYAELNTAFASAPIVVEVPDGLNVTAPVVVTHFTASDGIVTLPRVVARVGADASITILDHHSSADVATLTLPVSELAVGAGGALQYMAVNQLGLRAWQIASQVARCSDASSTLLASVALGGDYARVRTDARLDGRGASGNQIAAYFAEQQQMHDFRTLQDHAAPKTTSDLLFKGAVAGRARSVYSGLIRVRKEAPGTTAFQTNRNLKLSEGAWADSVPNLEIDTNDVRCSHASAVGPVDAEQRFYLESRGVPPDRAEELIVNGFFSEVLERLPVPEMVGPLRAQIAAKLSRRDLA